MSAFPDERTYRVSVTDRLADLEKRVAVLEQRLAELDSTQASAVEEQV